MEKTYELTVLLPPDTSPEPLEDLLSMFESHILSVNPQYKLTYPIEHAGRRYEKAIKVEMDIKMTSRETRLISKVLDHKRWCMRYLIVRKGQ